MKKALHMRRSSNWLGSWIFIPATRIRIPVAVQMNDKFEAYRNLGYIPKLILDRKEVLGL